MASALSVFQRRPRPFTRWVVVLHSVSVGPLPICRDLARNSGIPGDANGNRSIITGYGIGYWLWIGSIAVIVLGNLILSFWPTASATAAKLDVARESGLRAVKNG